MPRSSAATSSPAKLRSSLANVADFKKVLATLAAKNQQSIQRHLDLIDAEEDGRHGKVWRRLVSVMATLAPAQMKTVQQAIQFYIPDGAYRKQVFALHDPRNGMLVACCENILPQALKAGVLTAQRDSAETGRYRIGRFAQEVHVEALDRASQNLPEYCKDMTGWNRKALRITFAAAATPEQLATIEKLCALTAQDWA